MLRRTFLLGVAGAATTFVVPTAEAAAPWVFLGSKRVDPFADYDVFWVMSPLQFRKLRLTARGNGAFIYAMRVTYGNGTKDFLPVNWHIPQGGGSNILDLRGTDRYIRKVELLYGKRLNGRGRTMVQLHGRL